MPTMNGLTIALSRDMPRAMRLSPFSAYGLQGRIEAQGFGAVRIVPLGVVKGHARAVLMLGPCYVTECYASPTAPLDYSEARA